jgi:hypothetical protein
MGISPIPGIYALPVVKTRPAETDISRVFDVENSSKPDDDSYSGNARNASAGGEDDEAMDAEEMDEGGETQAAAQTAESESSLQIDYFA